MNADARIKQIGLITLVLGWPAIGLVYLFTGFGLIVEWSMPVLIGVTVGLATRWISERLGMT